MNFHGQFHPGLWHEFLYPKILSNNFGDLVAILSDNGRAGNKETERGFSLDTLPAIGYTIYIERKWIGHWWPSWTSNPVRGAERRPGWVRFPCTSAMAGRISSHGWSPAGNILGHPCGNCTTDNIQKSNLYPTMKPPEGKGARLMLWESPFNQSGAHDCVFRKRYP